MKITNQHGDLLFESVDEIPSDAVKVENVAGYVFERGDGTHPHVLMDVDGVEVFEKTGDIFVRVSAPARINHEEHGIQTLMPGAYKKRIERVFDYETEEARRVMD